MPFFLSYVNPCHVNGAASSSFQPASKDEHASFHSTPDGLIHPNLARYDSTQVRNPPLKSILEHSTPPQNLTRHVLESRETASKAKNETPSTES